MRVFGEQQATIEANTEGEVLTIQFEYLTDTV